MKNIAIIGAGISGLVLANRLTDHANITIFEKSRGVSGRLATRRAPPFQFDHGAPCFKANSKLFKDFLKPMLADGIVKRWQPHIMRFKIKPLSIEKSFIAPNRCYVPIPGMTSLAKYLIQHLTCRLNTQVDGMIKEDKHWQLVDKHGISLGHFDWVISSIPPEQAIDLLPDNLSFYAEISGRKMTPCFAVLLGFKKPLSVDFDIGLADNGVIRLISSEHSKPGRSGVFSIVLHSEHQWAKTHIDADRQAILSSLIKAGSELTQLDLKTANHQALHLWRYTQPENMSKSPFFIDTTEKIGACGDWCLGTNVESAFLSAHQLSEAVLPYLMEQ